MYRRYNTAYGKHDFPIDKDGYPEIGTVIQFYREKKKMTQKQLAAALGITEPAVWNIENAGTDVNLKRRRVLHDLLGIPGVLMGIALAEEIEAKKKVWSQPTSAAIDIKEAHITLLKYRSTEMKRSTQEIHDDSLLRLETYYNALYTTHELPKMMKLICGYHGMIAYIYKDRQQYNESLKHLERAGYFATTPTLKGLVSLHRGITLDCAGRYEDAIATFENAIRSEDQFPDHLRGDLLFNFGGTLATVAHSSSEKSAAIKMIDRGGNLARVSSESNYHRNFSDFGLDRYHLTKGVALVDIGWHERALAELKLTHNPADNVRRNAYTYIQHARISLGLGEHAAAAAIAQEAYKMASSIHSALNMARIETLHRQLVASPCKDSSIKALGYALGRR